MKTERAEAAERSFSIVTLGCKLNQYESETIRQYLVNIGWKYRSFGENVSFQIINTCTVTGKTDSRCRNAIRRARKIAPGSKIIVTGCYAETQPASLEAMRETDLVVGNDGKSRIGLIMENIIRRDVGKELLDEEGGAGIADIEDFSGHSRAFIKIQEGCNSFCSYCIIPIARGRSRSVHPKDILRQVKLLETNGLEEIVLTGIHIGRYGLDLGEDISLSSLLETLIEKTNRIRFRLSSIEVSEVSKTLIDLASKTWRIAPHFHIPLQSGDDDILAAMNRLYDTAAFREKIEEVKGACPDSIVGTDIIVGFPGETEKRFANTYEYANSLDVDYFHVFPFSRRPGTPADGMPDQIRPELKKSRSGKLIKLGKAKRKEFMLSRIGKREIGLIQERSGLFSEFTSALTGNYVEVNVKTREDLGGKLVELIITHYSRGKLYGRLLEREGPNQSPEQ